MFETIDGLPQTTNFVLHAFLDETFWLFEIDLLIYSRSPNKNAVLTSSASISQSSSAAMERRSQTDSNLATGEKVSSKSIL